VPDPTGSDTALAIDVTAKAIADYS
jgi:hypothetical protein